VQSSYEQNSMDKAITHEPHLEGGYFRRTYQSDYTHEGIPYAETPRYLMTSIFYMLTDDSPTDYLHVNHADIMHYFHAGSPLTYLILHPDRQLLRVGSVTIQSLENRFYEYQMNSAQRINLL